MSEAKYVAYVSTYTMKDDVGIHIYDVDMEKGRLSEKGEVHITNSSYLTISHNNKYMYAITDLGVESYKIEKDGMLTLMNKASINGMRGCYLSTSYDDRFLFVAGYHDAKITVLSLKKDGQIGEITDEVFHAGIGSIIERSYRPHVSCVKMTRDDKYLCACDLGMDQVKIYSLNKETGKLKMVDMIHCSQDAAPRYIKFHKNGKFAYIIHELSCMVDVYSYNAEGKYPEFTLIQSITTLNDYHTSGCMSCAMKFSFDHKLLICSNAGDNSVGVFSIDEETGMLEKILCLPVSGDYPKDIAILPDSKHLISLNHESDTMTFFNLDIDKKVIVMNGPEVKVKKGNCLIFRKL